MSPFIDSVFLFEVRVKDLRSSFTKYGSAVGSRGQPGPGRGGRLSPCLHCDRIMQPLVSSPGCPPYINIAHLFPVTFISHSEQATQEAAWMRWFNMGDILVWVSRFTYSVNFAIFLTCVQEIFWLNEMWWWFVTYVISLLTSNISGFILLVSCRL